MREDLLAAQASIDWAKTQFPSFHQRTQSWLNAHVKTTIRDPDPNVPNNVLVAFTEEPLPLALSVEAGIYIHVLRSSLDILATALAYRYSVPNPEDVYFPVAVSENVFASGGYKGVEFVKGLPAAQRALIEELKPYKGGNSVLWALHRLDILRKHKRLIEIAIWPGALRVTAMARYTGVQIRWFTPVADFVSVHDETILGLIAKGTKAKADIVPEIAINETDLLPRQAFIVALDDFAKLATDIVAKFDTP